MLANGEAISDNLDNTNIRREIALCGRKKNDTVEVSSSKVIADAEEEKLEENLKIEELQQALRRMQNYNSTDHD